MSSDPLAFALAAYGSTTRLQAAMATGTRADPAAVGALIERCAVEPDFFVREVLTWALVRLPADVTLPRLLQELDSPIAQARSQALHTLSKIGDRRAWPDVGGALLHDPNDEVARAAWRASVTLAPAEDYDALVSQLLRERTREGSEMQVSLSRALAVLGHDG